MVLKFHKYKRMYEVEIPEGSRVETTLSGTQMLLIPGPTPEDTSTWLPAHSIVGAARLGDFGRILRREQRELVPDDEATNQSISA